VVNSTHCRQRSRFWTWWRACDVPPRFENYARASRIIRCRFSNRQPARCRHPGRRPAAVRINATRK